MISTLFVEWKWIMLLPPTPPPLLLLYPTCVLGVRHVPPLPPPSLVWYHTCLIVVRHVTPLPPPALIWYRTCLMVVWLATPPPLCPSLITSTIPYKMTVPVWWEWDIVLLVSPSLIPTPLSDWMVSPDVSLWLSGLSLLYWKKTRHRKLCSS